MTDGARKPEDCSLYNLEMTVKKVWWVLGLSVKNKESKEMMISCLQCAL